MSGTRAPSPSIAGTSPVPGPLLVAAALVLLAVALFWPSISALAELWSHPARRTYQHGYVISLIALWLLYRERQLLADSVGAPAPILLLPAAAAGVAWAVAWNAGLQVAHFLLWPVVLWAIAAAILGWRAGRVLLGPVAFLYFALPMWDALMPVLQSATVLANRLLAAVIGMPALIEGNYIHIPEGTFEIAGGCSGLNYLVVGLAIAALLGEVNRDPPRRRLLLILLGGGLAIVSNWIRVFIIIVAGHVSDMSHYLVRVDHYNFGWVLYAFVLAAFFLIARRLPPVNAQPLAAPRAATVSGARRALVIAVGVLVLALGPALAGQLRFLPSDVRADERGVGVGQLELPGASRWQASPALDGWIPVFPGADAESLVEYSNEADRVTAYTATYVRQSQGHELIGHDSRIEGRVRGKLRSRGARPAGGSAGVEVMEAEWRGESGGHAVLWWAYRIGPRDFSGDLAAQLWYGLSSLWSDPVSAVVALRSECRPDCDQAQAALERFSAEALPDLLAAASRTGDGAE